MLKTYISPKFFYFGGLFTLFLLWIFEFHFLAFFWTIILVTIIILFKKKESFQDMDPSYANDFCFSPLNGIVKSINYGVNHTFFGKNLIEIRFSLPFFVEIGLYLPFTSEVFEMKKTDGKRFIGLGEIWANWNKMNRSYDHGLDGGNLNLDEQDGTQSGVLIKLRGEKGPEVGLKVLRSFLGVMPRVWIMTGDRGISGANFGYLPLGGGLLMYLPMNADILVKENDHVLAGQTLVAQLVGQVAKTGDSSPTDQGQVNV